MLQSRETERQPSDEVIVQTYFSEQNEITELIWQLLQSIIPQINMCQIWLIFKMRRQKHLQILESQTQFISHKHIEFAQFSFFVRFAKSKYIWAQAFLVYGASCCFWIWTFDGVLVLKYWTSTLLGYVLLYWICIKFGIFLRKLLLLVKQLCFQSGVRRARVISQYRYVGLICVFLDFEASYFDLAAPPVAVNATHHLYGSWLNLVSNNALLDQELVLLDRVILHDEFVLIVRGLNFFVSWRTAAIWWSWNSAWLCHRVISLFCCFPLRWIFHIVLDKSVFDFAYLSLLVERKVIRFIFVASSWYLLHQLQGFLIGAWNGCLLGFLRDLVIQAFTVGGVTCLLVLSWLLGQRLWADLSRYFALAQVAVMRLFT